MSRFEQFERVDLTSGPQRFAVRGGLFAKDAGGNRLGLIVQKNSIPVTVTGTIQGIAKLPPHTGNSVEKYEFNGVIDSNNPSCVYVDVPAEALYYPGQMTVAIRNNDGDTRTVLATFTGWVDSTTDGTAGVPPSTLPDDIEDFIAELSVVRQEIDGALDEIEAKGEEVLASIPQDYSELSADVSDLKSAVNGMPDIKDSDAEDVDLDFSDPNGNVILRLADGHIQTKNFDSSAIDPDVNFPVDSAYQITDDNADLYLSDAYGNSVARFADGYFTTKGFDSNEYSYRAEIAYTNTAGTKTITHFFPKGTRIRLGLLNAENRQTGLVLNYAITYSITKPNGVSVTLGSQYGYLFTEYVLPDDAVSVTAAYPNSLLGGSSGTLAFILYTVPTYGRKPHILTLAADGSKQFTTLRAALDSITDNNDKNPYIIYIWPGTYNVLSDYTAEEIATEGFKGPWVNNGVSLIGIGARNEVVLHGELSTETYNQIKRNNISTLNVAGDVTIENLRIEAINIRYGIHDDTGSGSQIVNTRRYINLELYGENLASGGDMNRTYGAGGGDWKHVIAKDCDFGDCFALHNNSGTAHNYRVDLENCTARRFYFAEYENNSKKTFVNMRNCKTAHILHTQVTEGADQALFIRGEGTSGMMITCPAGFVYETGDCIKFYNIEVAAGKAVSATPNTYPGIEATTALEDIYGISIGTLNGNTIVQKSGYINSNILGLSGLSVGDYLTIDSSGNVVDGGTSSNAIAVVTTIDTNGLAFAKLLI